MLTVTNYPHIRKVDDQPAHLERLPRIQVAHIVMDYLSHGWSVDEMCRQHPYLKPSEAYSAMDYYFDHQEEVDQQIQEQWQSIQEADSQPKSPFYSRLRSRGIL
ncbi:DUF433 domain-containing protein [Synechocystis sp. LEGE 06083]|uniref:DUF433 domain-containing protein n=1 Tax=Synechocystis sp. LEGE 06083 TaxID=915336 RepID=UPI001880FFBE|nr:DUF433 domain-containing protein [Synechocystis sp. LEGE 06083]MBE9196022.1 DUF433 domain-containing protein [Synechocystis sp. LEGE 06083]